MTKFILQVMSEMIRWISDNDDLLFELLDENPSSTISILFSGSMRAIIRK